MARRPTRPPLPRITSHWRERFGALMPYRVRDVLLVSSAYDAFLLEEDGPLAHRLLAHFSDLDLSWAPRLTHAATAAEGLALLERRNFQLVLIASSLEGSTAAELGARIRDRHANVPIVMLVFDEAQLASFPREKSSSAVDHVFLWTGNAGILIAIVKLIEDELNVEHDVEVGDVQVIGVVEDSVRAYSGFLTLLFPELLRQSRSLVAEGVNEWHRLLRSHARPKVALARSYEAASFWFDCWPDNLMGLISDVSFPHAGRLDPEAGLALARRALECDDPPPVLLHSSEVAQRAGAAELGAWFVDKAAPDAMKTVRRFLQEKLGFGDFVFRMPDGSEVARARSVIEMAAALDRVPIESVLHHAELHDFSRWLKARSMFQVARHTRGVRASDFSVPENVRAYLKDVLQSASEHDQAGVVTDFAAGGRTPRNRFVRLGSGSIGGKARSIGFVSALLVREGLLERFDDLQIRVPKTAAISVEEFDRFVTAVELGDLEELDDREIRQRVLDAPLSVTLLSELREAYEGLSGPLAVRSSSLREDARFQPFAGVYATYMLPNNHPDPEVRFAELTRAIKAVYASMYSSGARTYAAGHPRAAEVEKMGVLVQQLVGQAHGDRFYPHISGVAQSYNYYPIGPQSAEDGVAVIALGLGQMVVSGRGGLRFCPAHPNVLPQFPTPRHVLRYSQRELYALDLSQPIVDFIAEPGSHLRLYGLDVAEADGTLALAGSVYSVDDDAIRESLTTPGPRVVTFNNALRWHAIPLAEALQAVLAALGKAMASAVEIEFAVDMGDWGRPSPRGDVRKPPRLYVLQARPLAGTEDERLRVDLDTFDPDDVLIRTELSLGNGAIEDLRDVVYVRSQDLSAAEARAAAQEVQQIDARLRGQGRRYVLVGPGRWGSSDSALGIPVDWLHIAGARVIVELPLRGELLESSQGTHFFHNVTAARLGYLTASPQAHAVVDRAWLGATSAAFEGPLVRHIALEQPLGVYLDGRRGRAVITKSATRSDRE